MRVVVLAGGVGGARFVGGLRSALVDDPESEITVVVNTGDDLWLSGVRLQPDIDSILYALAGVNDTERGWGRAGETSGSAPSCRRGALGGRGSPSATWTSAPTWRAPAGCGKV